MEFAVHENIEVLLAMSKLVGVPLHEGLYRNEQGLGQQLKRELKSASCIVMQLVKQIIPVFATLRNLAFHRDASM